MNYNKRSQQSFKALLIFFITIYCWYVKNGETTLIFLDPCHWRDKNENFGLMVHADYWYKINQILKPISFYWHAILYRSKFKAVRLDVVYSTLDKSC